MKEDIQDLEALAKVTTFPKLALNPKTKMMEVENKALLKGMKDLDKKIEALERKQLEFKRIVAKLQTDLRRNVTITKLISAGLSHTGNTNGKNASGTNR